MTPTPINPEIVREHIERASAMLGERGADGLLLFRDTNILAFAGVPLGPTDRLVCSLLNRDGDVALVIPKFESSFGDQLPAGGVTVTWQEHENPWSAVAEAAARIGLDRGAILLDGVTWLSAQARLRAALPHAQLSTDDGIIDAVRAVKTADEIETIRDACGQTARIYPLIAASLRSGLSEQELAETVLTDLRRSGCEPVGELIQGGENASIPHNRTGLRKLRPGDAVIVDFVARCGGYHGDMTRTFAIGKPTNDVLEAYAVVRDAQRAAIEAVRPGVTCESIDAVARGIIESAGLGAYFSHRLGHGIGLDIHEPPYLVRGNRTILEPGMCVTIEPGVYVTGRFGIRIEDVVAVTEDGGEILSCAPTDVSEPFKMHVAA